MEQKKSTEEPGRDLRPQEKKFVHEYLIDMNGTKAAARAGYSEKTAASQASRLLKKPAVRAYRDALLAEQFDAIGITKHSIASQVWEIVQRCMDKKPVLEWDSSLREWVDSGNWEFDARGALKGLALLQELVEKMNEAEDDEDGERLEDMIAGFGRDF